MGTYAPGKASPPSSAATSKLTSSHDSLQQAEVPAPSVPKNFQDIIKLSDARTNFANLNGDGYSVVIIDSGVDIDHALFGHRLVLGHNLTEDNEIQDEINHGSGIASIIAGQESLGSFKGGIAPNVNVISLRVTDDDSIRQLNSEKALSWVIQNATALNIVAVNFSIGPNTQDRVFADQHESSLKDEFEILTRLGVTIVTSAGNKYEDLSKGLTVEQRERTSDYAVDPNTIAVGSLTKTGEEVFADSQRAPHAVFAPGELLLVASSRGGFSFSTGTSFATPVITGAVVLAQQLAEEKIGRRLNITELQKILVADNTNTVSVGDKTYKKFNLDEFLKAVDDYAVAVVVEEDAPDSRKDVEESAERGLIFQELDKLKGKIDKKSGAENKAVATDIDWYKLDLDAGTYKLILKASGSSSKLDPRLDVFVPATGQTFINDDHYLISAPVAIGKKDAAITFTLNENDQTVYVRASATTANPNKPGDKTGKYQFHITRTKLTTDPIIPILTATPEEFELLSFETDVLKLEGLTAGTTYTLRYKFTPSDADGLPDVISLRNSLADHTATGIYQRIDARLTTENGESELPLTLHAVPGPERSPEKYRFLDFVSTSFTAPANGDHFLRLADPTGRAWSYEIAVAAAFDDFVGVAGENFQGTAGDDELVGTYGDDTLNGGGGKDNLYGDSGNDTLKGGEGDDVLEGGAGADVLDGGDDYDTVRYINSPAGVTVNLETGKGKGGHAEGDTLALKTIEVSTGQLTKMIEISTIESIIGSWFNDTLTGDENNNYFRGLGGADKINGGGGQNQVSYFSSLEGVQVDLSDDQPEKGGEAEGDVLTNIQSISGSHNDDTLTGTNIAIGGANGRNIFWGAGGADTINGLTGDDLAVYLNVKELTALDVEFENMPSFTARTGVVIDLRSDGPQNTGNFREPTTEDSPRKVNNAYGDKLEHIEDLTGSKYDDLLIGNEHDNRLLGGDGDDMLNGLGGKNILIGDNDNGPRGADKYYLNLEAMGTNLVYGFNQADGDRIRIYNYADGLIPSEVESFADLGLETYAETSTRSDGSQGDPYAGIRTRPIQKLNEKGESVETYHIHMGLFAVDHAQLNSNFTDYVEIVEVV